MKKLALLASLIVAVAAGAVTASTATAAKPASTAVDVPGLTGSYTDAAGNPGTFTGKYVINRVAAQGGKLVAIGTVTGTMTDSTGTQTVTKSVITPAAATTGAAAAVQATAVCDILHLTLGPLDLDLLGLVVHLDPVVLDITAESGPGNLLGNLLCAVAGLLDPPTGGGGGGIGGLLQSIVGLLNQILGQLGG